MAASAGAGQPQSLFERDALFWARRGRFVAYSIGDEPLVLGRIDDHGGERRYIGRVGVTDSDRTQLVVDWRAPAAEAFYRATPRRPLGVVRRRHFHCRGRTVLAIDDELLDTTEGAERDLVLVGEGALFRALARTRTGRMRDIVATIQAEQDEIIRAPIDQTLVVQGGPGTGKTAVGLHRAAYMLYAHRERLERQGVLLVGPNPIFLRYVEHVLPSLGESSVRLATTGGLVPGVAATAADAWEPARVKGDLRMVDVLRRALDDRRRGLDRPVRILHAGELLELTPEATAHIVRRVSRLRGTHNGLLRTFQTAVLLHLGDLFRQATAAGVRARRRSGRVPKRMSHDERVEFFSAMLDQAQVIDALDAMWPALWPERLVRELLGSREHLDRAGGHILSEAERAALHEPAKTGWTPADVALVDEASVLLGRERERRKQPRIDPEEGFMVERMLDDLSQIDPLIRGERRMLTQRYADARRELEETGDTVRERATYGHVVVDEAQDLSPMQWRMLARRCPSRSMTILGDLGQATGPYTPAAWPEAIAALGARRTPAIRELTINYRTPEEVMDVATAVLAEVAPGLSPPRSVRRGEVPPSFVRTDRTDLVTVAAARALEERGASDGTVAVIASAGVAAGVREALGADAVAGPEGADELDAPIVVLAYGQAKGLEFDRVVVADPEGIVAEGGVRSLYVALTRVTQSLVVVHSGGLPYEQLFV